MLLLKSSIWRMQRTLLLPCPYCALWISSVLCFVQSWNCFLETIFSNSTINSGTVALYVMLGSKRSDQILGHIYLIYWSIYIAMEGFSGKMRMCSQYNQCVILRMTHDFMIHKQGSRNFPPIAIWKTCFLQIHQEE